MSPEHQALLSRLRSEYPGSDSQGYIDAFERDLSDLLEARESLDLPVSKRFAASAESKVKQLNALLLNDESLLNEKGRVILNERNLWGAVLSAFGLKGNNEAVRVLEELIRDKLPKEE